MKSPRVVHPFILAVFPTLFLFSHNINESILVVRLALLRLGVPIIITLSVTVVLWKLFSLFLKDAHKTGILLSTLILMFFSCGHFHHFLVSSTGSSILFTIHGIAVGPYKLYLASCAILLVAFIAFLRTSRQPLTGATSFLNITAIILVGLSLIHLAFAGKQAGGLSDLTVREEPFPSFDSPAPQTSRLPMPDIYYIILDEYAAATTLQEAYGFNNQPFLDFLRSHGFYIAPKACSNYTFTVLSLASSLNMMYINHLSHRFQLGEDLESSDLRVPIQMVEDNRVVRFLKSNGYTFIHFRSGYPPTEQNKYADWDVTCDRKFIQDRFIKLLLETTMIEPFFRRMASASKRDVIQCQFATLLDVSAIKGPRFILAHFMVPHEPYVFGANGEPVLEKERHTASQGTLYINQLQFTNQQLQSVIATILAQAESPPIIILQADHGIRHHSWETHRAEWARIFQAYYFPPGDKVPVYDTISPVNTFRVLFNYYFGTDHELLPDQTFFPVGEPYKYQFLDVSQQTQYP